MTSTTNTAGIATAAGTIAAGGAAAQTMPPLGPNSTAVPGPGDFNGGRVDFFETGVKGKESFGNFGCEVFDGSPNTPDWTTANAYFVRTVQNVDISMPDGQKLRCWAFGDPLKSPGREIFPSPLIRVQEGDLVHVKLQTSKGTHTIHHHGIEPTTMNDGVGHVSFEVKEDYTYQFQARHAGTFFYHCHKNTVTHFEMGLYGLLIVDPKPENGRVAAYAGGPLYDVERFWVLDDMDPRWHQITNLDHDVGLCGDDAGLNIFKPKYFLLTGTPMRPNTLVDRQKIVANSGQKILIRLLNASYSVLQVMFEGLEVQVISVDGHALNKPWNKWLTIAPGTLFTLSTAQRYDILIDTGSPANQSKAGSTNKVHFEFQDWITRRIHNAGDKMYEGRSYTTITI